MLLKLNKRKHQPHPLLFPGWKLQERIYKFHSLTQFVGEVFEGMTEHIVMSMDRGTLRSDVDVCPDLIDEEQKIIIEVKASRKKNGHKVHHHQVYNYQQMNDDGWKVIYAFWTYNTPHLLKEYKNVRELIEGIVKGVMYLDLLDLSIVSKMIEQSGKRVCLREVTNWSDRAAAKEGGDDPITIVGSSFLERLRATPDTVLIDELGMKEKSYSYLAQGEINSALEYNGVKFKSGAFVVWQITC